jgi:hypothetical protein
VWGTGGRRGRASADRAVRGSESCRTPANLATCYLGPTLELVETPFFISQNCSMATPPPLSLGDCLADTNYSSLDLIFARVTTEGGTATPLARATVVRLTAAICTQIIVPSITDPVTTVYDTWRPDRATQLEPGHRHTSWRRHYGQPAPS